MFKIYLLYILIFIQIISRVLSTVFYYTEFSVYLKDISIYIFVVIFGIILLEYISFTKLSFTQKDNYWTKYYFPSYNGKGIKGYYIHVELITGISVILLFLIELIFSFINQLDISVITISAIFLIILIIYSRKNRYIITKKKIKYKLSKFRLRI